MNINKNKKLRVYKILFVFCIISCLLITLVSCKEKDNEPIIVDGDYLTFPEEFKGILKDKEIYFTSIGQANDLYNFELSILNNLELFDYTLNSFLTIDEVPNNAVVFVFVGCSVKSLAETGTSIEQEMNRTIDFINKKDNKNITLISLHIGGKARRGSTSNQFIEKVFSNSDFNIFVELGNYDKYLSSTSFNNNIPCYKIVSITELNSTMKMLYGVEE